MDYLTGLVHSDFNFFPVCGSMLIATLRVYQRCADKKREKWTSKNY